MINAKINGISVSVSEGTTILEAPKKYTLRYLHCVSIRICPHRILRYLYSKGQRIQQNASGMLYSD
jgi:hypothetical protein